MLLRGTLRLWPNAVARMFRPTRTMAHGFYACAMLAVAVSTCRAETWAERLGFPADRKVLILHAHDFGMCHEANAAVTGLLENGSIHSASAMAPCPWFHDAAKWCAAHPDADVGLDLTVNSEWENYRWRPVAADALVATLVGPDRFFWRSPTQTMVNATADEVERELIAQIECAKMNGLQPTHLTAHLGTLFTRPDLIEVYLRVARQQWIPAMVVEVTPQQLDRFQRQGFPLPDDLVNLLSDYPLPKVDDLQLMPRAESYEDKKAAFVAMLNALPAGLTQIAFHPAIETDALQRIVPAWQQRVWELKMLQDPDVRAVLASDQVILTDWRQIMERFEGRRPPEDATSSPEPTPAN